MKKHSVSSNNQLRAADLFCGGGGFTTGAEQADVNVLLAVNHWRTAIYTHQQNHPDTRHICARIDDIDPRHDRSIPELDLLLASPECTHHSIARGGMPIDDQKRATPWHVVIWAEAKRPADILIENVREFRDWGPLDANCRPIKSRKGEIFQRWIEAMQSIGYRVDHQILNAADFGAATKRLRLFIHAVRDDVYRKRGRKIVWPEPTHVGHWLPAWSIIDWSKPCPSIFSRKRPLAEKTLRRIEIGLRKYVGGAADPFIVKLRNHQDTGSVDDPLGTITTSGAHHGLAVPFVCGVGHTGTTGRANYVYDPSEPLRTVTTREEMAVVTPFQFKAIGRNPGLTKGIGEPVPTIVACRENHAIVMPYLVPHFGERDGQEPRTHSIEESLPTVTGQGAGSLAIPFMQTLTHGGRDRSLQEPFPTITTAHRGEHALTVPFLTKYYGTGGVQSIDEPVDTITTRDRFGLAMVSLIQTMKELGVVDIGFRMLDADELARAQGFPDGYYLHGTKAEQVKQVGNAVCPPVARALCQTITEAA